MSIMILYVANQSEITLPPQAITIIFKSLNIKCVPYIQTVIPAYLTVFRGADPSFREVGDVYFASILSFFDYPSCLLTRLPACMFAFFRLFVYLPVCLQSAC